MSKVRRIFFSAFLCLFLCVISVILYIWGYNIFLKKAYPIKYEQIVLEASQRYNIEPELIYAVIKNESDFLEDAESNAGAKGLMQITDDTFAWLQLYRGNPGMDSSYLKDPSINIDYGVMFICILRKKYGTDDHLVLSAYNAGMNAVERWLKDDKLSDDGEELKAIPYNETRRYIEKVIQSKSVYKKLYFK